MRTVSVDDGEQLHGIARQLARSRRVAFVVGAGISTASGIPDFRSATTGLFASLKERNPDVKISSGKDLFHSNLFQREDTTRAFYMMIAELKKMADLASPTAFHELMKDIQNANRLFRIYTQNIDGLEAKTGLSYGLGEWKEVRRPAPASPNKGKGKIKPQIPSSPSKKVAGQKRKAAALEEPSSSQPLPASSQDIKDEVVPHGLPMASSSQASLSSTTQVVMESQSLPDAERSVVAESVNGVDSFGDSSLSSIADSSLALDDVLPASLQASQDATGSLSHVSDTPPIAASLSTSSPLDTKPMMPPSLPSSQVWPASPSSAPPSSQESPAEPQMRIFKSLTTPMVIPLHGSLESMHCTKCQHIEPLVPHLAILEDGHSILCPKCQTSNASRSALGERSRGQGVMKVSVVLYGEEHSQAARVGEIAEKDLLKAARPDFLVVAGTTLKIPGVKKLVKELAKVIKPEIEVENVDANGAGTGVWVKKPDPSTRVIYVNNDAPAPETTWNSVFDVFVQGDIQTFANAVRQEVHLVKVIPIRSQSSSGTSTPYGVARPAIKQTLLNFKSVKGVNKLAVAAKPVTHMPATAPLSPPKPKEKVKPGWKGYALVAPGEVVTTKQDYWATEVQGKRRRGGISGSTEQSQPASAGRASQIFHAISSSAAPIVLGQASSMPAQPYKMSPKWKPAPLSIPISSGALTFQTSPKAATADGPSSLRMTADGSAVDIERYCTCGGFDDGRMMVQCENEACPHIWYHTDCLPGGRVPKAKHWFCQLCRPIKQGKRKGSADPTTGSGSAGCSSAPSPPSLASDISTVSDLEDIKSQQGDADLSARQVIDENASALPGACEESKPFLSAIALPPPALAQPVM